MYFVRANAGNSCLCCPTDVAAVADSLDAESTGRLIPHTCLVLRYLPLSSLQANDQHKSSLGLQVMPFVPRSSYGLGKGPTAARPK